MSPTNLIAALRLALDLWKREYQEKNTREIVKRGTALYEKLVSFTETFERIGETLKTASAAYDTALGQLSAGKGNVIRQAEMLKELGITRIRTATQLTLPRLSLTVPRSQAKRQTTHRVHPLLIRATPVMPLKTPLPNILHKLQTQRPQCRRVTIRISP